MTPMTLREAGVWACASLAGAMVVGLVGGSMGVPYGYLLIGCYASFPALYAGREMVMRR